MFLYIHRIQPYPYLVKIIKILVTLKLIQLLRKFVCRHLWESVINTVSLKEIKQLFFEQQPFGFFFKFSKSINICVKLSTISKPEHMV